jgi:hypothetical protein
VALRHLQDNERTKYMHGNLTSSSLLEVVERDAWLDLFAAAFGLGSMRH